MNAESKLRVVNIGEFECAKDAHALIDKMLKDYDSTEPVSAIVIVYSPAEKPRVCYAGRVLSRVEMNGVLMSSILENSKE